MGRDLTMVGILKDMEARAKQEKASSLRHEYERLEREAQAEAKMIAAAANLIENPSVRHAAMNARMAKLNEQIVHAQSRVTMFKAKMLVDALSIVDPTIIGTEMVSIWMDTQIEGLDQ